MPRSLRTLFLCVSVLFCASLCFAQRTTATLYGSVQDPSGGAVQGAALKLTSATTGATWESTTNDRGEFVFSFIPPGTYAVEAKAQGFKVYSRSGFTVSSAEQVRYPIQLELGQSSE